MVSAFIDPMDLRLNVAGTRADRRVMTRNEEELAEAQRKRRFAGVRARLTRRSSRRTAALADSDREVEALRERVALLAMHVDYWRYRSGQHASALRAAEAEVSRLNEALASTDRPLVTH
ncbi:MAG: hypothetical protein ABSC41_10605 [Acidimicrobiales bacterium]